MMIDVIVRVRIESRLKYVYRLICTTLLEAKVLSVGYQSTSKHLRISIEFQW